MNPYAFASHWYLLKHITLLLAIAVLDVRGQVINRSATRTQGLRHNSRHCRPRSNRTSQKTGSSDVIVFPDMLVLGTQPSSCIRYAADGNIGRWQCYILMTGSSVGIMGFEQLDVADLVHRGRTPFYAMSVNCLTNPDDTP